LVKEANRCKDDVKEIERVTSFHGFQVKMKLDVFALMAGCGSIRKRTAELLHILKFNDRTMHATPVRRGRPGGAGNKTQDD